MCSFMASAFRALLCRDLTTAESRVKVLRLLNVFKPHSGLDCYPFYGGGSVVIDLLFNVLPIVCGDSVFVFVLESMTLCPF